MDDRVLSPEDARDRLTAWKGRIDKLATDTKAMSDRFQQLQVTRKDAKGMAEVTVDSTGSLIGLKLSRDIDRASPDVIAATIMSTIRDAKAELAERTQEIVAETIGTDSAAGRAIAERVGQQLRGPAQDEERVERAPRAVEHDDNGDNELNIWR
jgi:DNA-binding protein YbaB